MEKFKRNVSCFVSNTENTKLKKHKQDFIIRRSETRNSIGFVKIIGCAVHVRVHSREHTRTIYVVIPSTFLTREMHAQYFGVIHSPICDYVILPLYYCDYCDIIICRPSGELLTSLDLVAFVYAFFTYIYL